VHSEITRDENDNHHYANDVENHLNSPRSSHLKKLHNFAIRARRIPVFTALACP
jgi:hypothetical protein